MTVETVLQRELDGCMGADVSGVPGRGGSDRQRLFAGDAGDVLAQTQVNLPYPNTVRLEVCCDDCPLSSPAV